MLHILGAFLLDEEGMMCRQECEDLIDFPVSDTFRDHYFDKGMTQWHSPQYKNCRDALRRDVDELTTTVKTLAKALTANAQPVSERHPWTTPTAPPQPRQGGLEIP